MLTQPSHRIRTRLVSTFTPEYSTAYHRFGFAVRSSTEIRIRADCETNQLITSTNPANDEFTLGITDSIGASVFEAIHYFANDWLGLFSDVTFLSGVNTTEIILSNPVTVGSDKQFDVEVLLNEDSIFTSTCFAENWCDMRSLISLRYTGFLPGDAGPQMTLDISDYAMTSLP